MAWPDWARGERLISLFVKIEKPFHSGEHGSIMLNYLIILFFFVFLSGCENTDFMTVTEAGRDAVKALTLSDKDLQEIASQAAQASDKKNTLAPPENKYAIRLNQLIGQNRQDGNLKLVPFFSSFYSLYAWPAP